MKQSLLNQIMALKDLSAAELKQKYAELHDGKPSPINNKTYLWRRIAYRLQELEYGGLSEKAREKLINLIREHDPVNNKDCKPESLGIHVPQTKKARDRRLPIPGTTILKEYKGVLIEVKVLEKGFEYRGQKYVSLSAIAKEVTGAHWNGYLFFGM